MTLVGETRQGCFRLQAYGNQVAAMLGLAPPQLEVVVTCLACGERISQTRCTMENLEALGEAAGEIAKRHPCWVAIGARVN